LARAICATGAPALLRRAHRRHATVLLYHDPSPAVMDAHLAWLLPRFTATTLDVVVDAIHARDWSRVPEGALVVTLDDGHRRNYDLLPVFRRHGVRPTIYLCSQVIGTDRRFWFQAPGVNPDAFKHLSNAARLEALKARYEFEPERAAPAGERQALSLAEIEEMAPHVDFQVHTRFHPMLQQCTEAEAWEEVAGSKRELEALLGRECRHFSYPNGDYFDREVELVRRAGFASARTVDLGWTHAESDPYRLKIFGISDDVSVPMLASQLSGIPGYVRRLAQGRRGGMWPVIAPAR
jgi:peptidoglycan/xylan/chitin deacetylase (PgdA/CDA1 family)